MAKDKYVGKHRKGKGGTMKDAGEGSWTGHNTRSSKNTQQIPKLTQKKMQAEDDNKRHGKS